MNQRMNALLSALTDRRYRTVIASYRNASEDRASIDDVASALARRDRADETQISRRLHRVALPKLDDVRLVDEAERLFESGFGISRRSE